MLQDAQSDTPGQGATRKHAQVARARSLLPDKVHVLEVLYETPYIRDTSPLVRSLLYFQHCITVPCILILIHASFKYSSLEVGPL